MPAVLQHNWWALAIRGIAAILFGILTFVAPGITLAVLVIWFGAYALIDGIFSIIAAWRAPDGRARWGFLLIEGVAGIAAGILTFIWPMITAAALVFIIAAWAIVTGVLEIAAAIRLRHVITGEWALIAMGALSVLFGLLIMTAPVTGALVITFWIGAYALVFGVLMLILAFRMRHWLRSRVTGPAFGQA
jgi:uncharacterized membrane protein HdeD (DUF308 family)